MRAMITGASSGIGRDIAINLAKLDYDLILVGREREALENVKNIIGDKVKIKIVVVDLSNLQKVKELYVLTRNDDIDLEKAVYKSSIGTGRESPMMENVLTGREVVYNLSGIRVPKLQKGINIVKYADGSIKKVFVR